LLLLIIWMVKSARPADFGGPPPAYRYAFFL